MDFVVKKDGKQFVDVVKILPETLPSGKRILWREVDDRKIEIFVDKSSARGGNAKPIVIKRFIEINELLFEGLGLRFGDGIKLQGGLPKVFGFSNVNLNVHKHFLKFAKECFGLDSSQFRVAITIPPTLSNKLEEIENNVSKKLRIPKENFFKTRVMDKRNNPILDIKITSTLLALVLNQVFDNLQDILFSNKLFCACVLRGIIASEANIHLTPKERRLGEITIAGKEKDKRLFIRKLLESLGIIPDKDKEIRGMECVLVTGLSNFKIFKEWDLCRLHPAKFKNFNEGITKFKKIEFRKGEGKFLTLKILAEQGPKRAIEIAKILNRSFFTILNESLLLLEKMNLVERERHSREVFWKITERGLKILASENPLERLKKRS
jgi:DNA-binding HxlR family transcriptional regulator